MGSVFVDALRALFESPLGIDAIYRAPGGDDLAIRVVRDQATRHGDWAGITPFIGDGDQVQIQRSDVDHPQVGNQIVIEGATFEISAEPELDVEAVSWTCSITPVEL